MQIGTRGSKARIGCLQSLAYPSLQPLPLQITSAVTDINPMFRLIRLPRGHYSSSQNPGGGDLALFK